MALELRVSHRESYMSAKAEGPGSVQDFRLMLEAVSEETMRMSARRLLLDLRNVREQLKFMEHVVVSDLAVSLLNHMEKVASVVPEGRKKGTSEQAARMRGVALRVFTSESEAVDWLQA
jgi:hypothetical protein